MSARPLRIALLAHSTNPRGGVVHALELGRALARLGHEAVVHAPDADGRGFFRAGCPTVPVAASPLPTARTRDLVEVRVADYLHHFADPERRRFDVFHAHDGISANALATLKARGLVDGFARTVHHVDTFDDPHVAALQRRAIVAADVHFVVSPHWRERLRADYGVDATVVGNGVDLARYASARQPGDAALCRRLALGPGPVFLSIGGVERRKNTIRILQAFAGVRELHPAARLVIAGGSSLLDHGAYQADFARAQDAAMLPRGAVVRTGPLADADVQALYRLADALVFPSIEEGFGLVVLEAMASGLPVVTSAIPPFVDYLGPSDALWCVPDDVGSVATAMRAALAPGVRAELSARGLAVAARHDWGETARAHLPTYATLGALQHA